MLGHLQSVCISVTGASGSGRRVSGLPGAGSRALVVGLGHSGLSSARFLHARGVEVAVTDSRPQPPGLDQLRNELPDVALFVGDFSPHAFEAADLVVVSPGVPLTEPEIARARGRGVELVGDIELFARAARAPVIAVTGSNGKSTVATMVARIAAAAGRKTGLGGNIGTPALELLHQEADLYVLELSSFQLESTSTLNAVSAALLNITPDHMDRYPDLAAYQAAKGRVFHGDGAMVLNGDDPRVMAFDDAGRRCVRFHLGVPGSSEAWGILPQDGQDWLARGDEAVLPVSELAVTGRHNLANALAAMALADGAGLPLSAMGQGLRDFTGLEHRSQRIAEIAGVVWVNDSKATNVGAAMAAIAGMPGPVVLIAGGQGKGADFSPLHDLVRERARAVVLMGEDAPLLEAALSGATHLERVADLGAAVQRAAALARKGDTVLFSPACASFDMFSGFEARGHAFIDAVGKLTQ